MEEVDLGLKVIEPHRFCQTSAEGSWPAAWELVTRQQDEAKGVDYLFLSSRVNRCF